ncbi:HAD family phosphatase, partial [Pseudoalteromonas sp. S186]
MCLQSFLFVMYGTLGDSVSMNFVCWSTLLGPFGVSYLEEEFCQRFSGRPTLEAAIEFKSEN